VTGPMTANNSPAGAVTVGVAMPALPLLGMGDFLMNRPYIYQG
jgi:hypothetical protein